MPHPLHTSKSVGLCVRVGDMNIQLSFLKLQQMFALLTLPVLVAKVLYAHFAMFVCPFATI